MEWIVIRTCLMNRATKTLRTSKVTHYNNEANENVVVQNRLQKIVRWWPFQRYRAHILLFTISISNLK